MSGAAIHSRPVRVLHLRDSPWLDGPGRTIIESGVHFDARRVDYHVGVFVDRSDASHAIKEEAIRRGVNAHSIVDRGGIDFRAISQIGSLIDSLGIDVLHTSDLRSRVYGLIASRNRCVVTVSTAHGWIANNWIRRIARLLDKTLLRHHDHVIFVSGATRDLIPRWWLPDSRVSVVHNALVLGRFGDRFRTDMKLRLPRGPGTTLLNVGRLSPEKGQDLLIRAVVPLMTELPELRLRIVGIGPEESRLRARVRDLGVDQRVEFLGYVSDMNSVYAAADLVVQSSLTEGLPNVILEAAYIGIPVVATDVGGTREIIEHGVSGWLVQPGSVDSLEAGLRCYQANPMRFLQMTTIARQRVVAGFSFDTRTERMMLIYERLVESAA